MYLAAVCPPNNADTALLELKRTLFRELSSISAWALRPMLPFAVFAGKPPKPLRKVLPPLPEGGLRFSSVERVGNQLALGSEEGGGFCRRLSELEIFRTSGPLSSPLSGGFECCSAVHLLDTAEACAGKAADRAVELVGALDPVTTVWKTGSLKLYQAEFSDGNWWERVVLDLVWELNFPKGSRR